MLRFEIKFPHAADQLCFYQRGQIVVASSPLSSPRCRRLNNGTHACARSRSYLLESVLMKTMKPFKNAAKRYQRVAHAFRGINVFTRICHFLFACFHSLSPRASLHFSRHCLARQSTRTAREAMESLDPVKQRSGSEHKIGMDILVPMVQAGMRRDQANTFSLMMPSYLLRALAEANHRLKLRGISCPSRLP